MLESWKVDRGFNLYIDVTEVCNASCPFCIAPTQGRKDGTGFFEGLEWALDFTQKSNGSVQVTGGEPTLSNRLPRILSEIGKRIFHRKVLNTNAYDLSDPVVSQIRDARISHVNISRHHFHDRENQKLMQIQPGNKAKNALLYESFRRVEMSGIPVRMNCNLVLGFIDDFEKVQQYIQWCESFGCRNVAFSQTFPLGVFAYQQPIEIGFAERSQVDLDVIVNQLDTHAGFIADQKRKLEAMSMWGHSTWIGSFVEGGHRRFWKTQSGMEVSIKTLAGWDQNGVPLPTTYSRADDPELQDGQLCFAVVHPDGTVSASWNKRERVLFWPRNGMFIIKPEALHVLKGKAL